MENSFQIEGDASFSEDSSHFVSWFLSVAKPDAGCRKYRDSDFVLEPAPAIFALSQPSR
jgi:hypothetical protein